MCNGTRALEPAAGLAAASLALFALLAPAPLHGQAHETALRGTVVDARTATPVDGATVVLEPERAGVFPGTSSGFAASARTTSTNAQGSYRFGDLTPGVYRIYVTRFGYRPYSLVVELGGVSGAVSIGLEAEPIALEPLRNRPTRARGPYVAADAYGPNTDLARLMVVDLRRRRFLTTDVRELTHADVVEGVTLGEPDVFRALQRLPGVTTRSDYTAELWTRGAPWAQTRVFYDGIPLYNPLHALGMLSGISSSAIGTVWFHPGVRPAAMGSGAAGAIDLRSRRAAGVGELSAQGDLSLMAAGASLDQRVLDGRAGWLLTGRRSYLDWLADLARRASGTDDATFPYGFSEVSGHVDAWIGERSSVETSFLWEGDRLSSSAGPDRLHADWGNSLVQATWTTRVGGLNVQHTVGRSLHRGEVTEAVDATNTALEFAPADHWAETRIGYLGLRGAVWPDPTVMGGPPWTVGYEVNRQAVEYYGPFPLPIPRSTSQAITVGPDAPQDPVAVRVESSLPMVAVWGETNWAPDDRWSIRAGLRLEAGEALQNVGELRAAPRLAVRYTPEPEVSFSAGYSRIYQYAQALAPSGVQMASLVSTDVWLLSSPAIPAVRSDIVTTGLETSLAPGRIATINAFGRRATGLTVPDPTPGPVFERDLFITGRSTAYGLEASVRQLVGPVTGSVSYTLSRSRTEVGGLRFPSSSDRPHVLNATAMARVLEPLRVGAAFTAATGVPFTRTISDSIACLEEPRCDTDALPWAGDPNAQRAPMYASLDLLVDYSTRWAGLEVGIYGQLRNVLGRENAVVYTGTGSGCSVVGCSLDDLRNAYEQGVPRLPVIGVRVRR